LTRTTWFRRYAHTVLENAKAMESRFATAGSLMVTGGTDKHYLVLDVARSFQLSGVEAERRLESIGILSNRQTLPQDSSNRAAGANGLRLGTAWATSRGYVATEFDEIARLICLALSGPREGVNLPALANRVAELTGINRNGDVWKETELSEAELADASGTASMPILI
jgi:glycine hydroxymethyltransferase